MSVVIIIIAYGLFTALAAFVTPKKLREFGAELPNTAGVALFILAASLHPLLAMGESDGD